MSTILTSRVPVLGSPQLRKELRFWTGLAAVFVISTATLLCGWVVFARAALGWDATVVTSGSMAPAIRPGDVVLLDPFIDDPGVNSVVRFAGPDGQAVLHRIVEERPDGLVTRGDANATRDSTLLRDEDVLGVGVVVVPLIGAPLVWWRDGRWASLAVLVAITAWGLRLLRGGVLANDPWSTTPEAPRRHLDGPFTASVVQHASAEASVFLRDEVLVELREAGIEFRLDEVVGSA